MAQPRFGAFDRNGNPIQSNSNPAYTGQPVTPPVLKPLPSPAPLPLFSPADLPRAPSVQPQGALPAPMQMAGDPSNRRGALMNGAEQRAMDEIYPPVPPDQNAAPTQLPERGQPDRRGFWRRAMDVILPPAGAAELPNAWPRRYVGAGSDYPTPVAPVAQWGGTGGGMGGALTQTIANRRPGFDPVLGIDPSINPGDQIAQQGARDKYMAQQAALTRQPAPAPIGSMAPLGEQLRGMWSDLNAAGRGAGRGLQAFGTGVSETFSGFNDLAQIPADAAEQMFGPSATSARQYRALGVTPPKPVAPRRYIGEGGSYPTPSAPRRYIGEGSAYPTPDVPVQTGGALAAEQQPPGAPVYQMGANGALTLAMPGGGTAELTPGAGANRLGVRASELAGQPLGGGQFETDAQVAARRPDLYGADGRPRSADAFGNARNPALDEQLAASQELTAALQGGRPSPMVRGLLARADAASESAASARGAGTAASRRELASRLYAEAQQAQQAEQQGALGREQIAATRRGQDLQLAGRERRAPIVVGTPDGGHVLYDDSGQWISPPGATAGGGPSKKAAGRLKNIGDLMARAMGMDKNDIALPEGQGMLYGNGMRVAGSALLATENMPAFSGYTDAHFMQIGQDVATGRAEIKAGANGMAYAVYRGADGQPVGGVPIGPMADYAAFQTQAPAAPPTR